MVLINDSANDWGGIDVLCLVLSRYKTATIEIGQKRSVLASASRLAAGADSIAIDPATYPGRSEPFTPSFSAR